MTEMTDTLLLSLRLGILHHLLRFVGRGCLFGSQLARLRWGFVFLCRGEQVDVRLGAAMAARREHWLVNAGHARAGMLLALCALRVVARR